MYNSQDRVERRTKERKFTRVLSVFVLLAALLVSGYYVFSTTITDGAYKIYVGGKGYDSNHIGIGGSGAGPLGVTYDRDGKTYGNVTGKEKKNRTESMFGGQVLQDSITDPRTEIKYSSGLNYLTSVGSNDERSVQTEVEDNGASGSANGDEFLASKFFLKNNAQPDKLTAYDGIVEYGIRIDITANDKNALSAARFGVMKVMDEEKIYNFETGTRDNSCFDMFVVAQPKMEKQENGDTLIYKGDEENSEEYVSSLIAGDYTNTPGTKLLKNPNKGFENEDWLCKNLHLNEKSNQWYYDSQEHEVDEERKTYFINPGEAIPYVIAAWYEATDPNHNNDILGGHLSFDVTFYVVE